MASDQISVRIDHGTKKAAEGVFNALGLSATDAIRMFYRQVALRRGLPFSGYVSTRPNAIFTITLSHDRKAGVWCANSDDIPGLNIEAESEQEAKSEAERWAPELLVDNHLVAPHMNFDLRFVRK